MTRRFQFSLRALLGATTLIATVSSVILQRPNALSGAIIFLAMLAIPGGLWAGAASAGGHFRAFMIGAAIPSSIGLWLVIDLFSTTAGYANDETPFPTLLWIGLGDFASLHRAHFLLLIVAAAIGGTAGTLAHWIASAGNRE